MRHCSGFVECGGFFFRVSFEGTLTRASILASKSLFPWLFFCQAAGKTRTTHFAMSLVPKSSTFILPFPASAPSVVKLSIHKQRVSWQRRAWKNHHPSMIEKWRILAIKGCHTWFGWWFQRFWISTRKLGEDDGSLTSIFFRLGSTTNCFFGGNCSNLLAPPGAQRSHTYLPNPLEAAGVKPSALTQQVKADLMDLNQGATSCFCGFNRPTVRLMVKRKKSQSQPPGMENKKPFKLLDKLETSTGFLNHQLYFVSFHSENWGRWLMTCLTSIFFKGVGSTTN